MLQLSYKKLQTYKQQKTTRKYFEVESAGRSERIKHSGQSNSSRRSMKQGLLKLLEVKLV
jgi:hypothetical protein